MNALRLVLRGPRRTKAEIQEFWRLLDETERQAYRELFDEWKPLEENEGDAASEAMRVVLRWRLIRAVRLAKDQEVERHASAA